MPTLLLHIMATQILNFIYPIYTIRYFTLYLIHIKPTIFYLFIVLNVIDLLSEQPSQQHRSLICRSSSGTFRLMPTAPELLNPFPLVISWTYSCLWLRFQRGEFSRHPKQTSGNISRFNSQNTSSKFTSPHAFSAIKHPQRPIALPHTLSQICRHHEARQVRSPHTSPSATSS